MKKVFRLFISSTFSDFKKEREVLQTKVFPNIKDYASKKGYIFQPIDLRWGVSNEAQLDQKTLELCLNEVRACKTNLHPNFLIMVGDRYGWIPLPYAIEQKEFSILLSQLNPSQQEELQEWYKLDLNQIPNSFILKERAGKYKDFDTWVAVENKLRDMLQEAVKTSNLSDIQKEKYFLSATEAEVQEGILPYNTLTSFQKDTLLAENKELLQVDHEHIFGFFRDIDKITKAEGTFIDDDTKDVDKFKKDVKEQLEEKNTLDVNTKQIDKELLVENYLIEFENEITNFLKAKIDNQKEKEQIEDLTPLEEELLSQNYFSMKKREGYLITKELGNLQDKINNYISDDNQKPLIIHAPSGRGKSSLMAATIDEYKKSEKKKVIYRFVGATPHSGSSKEVLTSIFKELGVDMRSEKEKEAKDGDTFSLQSHEDQESFEDFSQRVKLEFQTIKKDIVIFIDAIDQVDNEDQFRWLPKNLPTNLKIVISALDDENYEEDSNYFNTLKTKIDNLLEVPAFSEPLTLANNLLSSHNRQITKTQQDYFLEQFKEASSPLYVSVAVMEMKNWKSDDNSKTLAITNKGIIKEFIHNLSEVHHHNKKFVNRVLGYIYASRDGISESELLQLISIDKEFIEKVAPQEYHKNHTQELPLVHWSRLYTELKQFLSLKTKDNEELMYFFHREFEVVIKESPNQREEHDSIIEATQELILQNQDKEFDANRWGNLYATLITEYELRYKDKEKQIKFAELIANTESLKEEWIKEYINNISSISSEHNEYNRIYKAISYGESLLYTTEKLYQENPNQWLIDYMKSLVLLAASYTKQNRLSMSIQLLNILIDIWLLLEHDDKISSFGFFCVSSIVLSGNYDTLNKVEESIGLLEKNLIVIKPLYDSSPKVTENLYIPLINSLATYYYKQNRINKAIEQQNIVLEITEKLYQENQSQWAAHYARSLNNIAESYKKQNQLDRAIEIGERALEITEKLYQENPAQWVELYTSSLINLSMSYKEQNQLDRAIEIGERALEITEKLYQENPAQWVELYTSSLNNLSMSYNEQNQLDRAIEIGERALEITEKLYQENPAQWVELYTLALTNLASSYKYQNRVDEAINLEERSLEIREKLYQENPTQWAENYVIVLNNLAISYKNQNQQERGLALERKSLEILEQLYKENPAQWVKHYTISLINLATSYSMQNQLDRAIELQERSLEIREKLYKENPVQWTKYYISSLNELAVYYKNQNRVGEVKELEGESLEILEKLYQDNPAQLAEDYLNQLIHISEKYIDQNQLDKAIELKERAFEITEILYKKNPENWVEWYLPVMGLLADNYGKQNQLDKAIILQKKVLEVTEVLYKKDNDTHSKDYIRILNNLIELYYKIDKLDIVIEIEKRALKTLNEEDKENWWYLYTVRLHSLAKNQSSLDKELEIIKQKAKIEEMFYQKNKNNLIDGYMYSLNHLISSYLKDKNFKNAANYLKKYFEIVTFKTYENIASYYIYPYVKYYLCLVHLEDKEGIKNLESLVEKEIRNFNLDNSQKWSSIIEKEYTLYKEFAEGSDDDVDKEMFRIYCDVFMGGGR